MNEKARAEQLVVDARKAVEEQAGLDRVRPLIADLQQMLQRLPASAAAAAGAGSVATAPAATAPALEEAAEDEEVVDAEFTRE